MADGAPSRYKNTDIPKSSFQTQTELHVTPHFLPFGALANVVKETGVQTAISAQPNVPLSTLIPELQKLSPPLLNSDSIHQLSPGKAHLSWREGGIVEPDPREIKHPVSSDMLSKSALKYPSIIDIVKPCISTVVELAINIAANYSDVAIDSVLEKPPEKQEDTQEVVDIQSITSFDIEVQTNVLVRPFFVPPNERASVWSEMISQTLLTFPPSIDLNKVYPALRSSTINITNSGDFVIDIPKRQFLVDAEGYKFEEYTTCGQTFVNGTPVVAQLGFELIIKVDPVKISSQSYAEIKIQTSDASRQALVRYIPKDVDEHLIGTVLNNAIIEVLANSLLNDSNKADQELWAQIAENRSMFHNNICNTAECLENYCNYETRNDIHQSINELNTLVAALIFSLNGSQQNLLQPKTSSHVIQSLNQILCQCGGPVTDMDFTTESINQMCRYIEQETECYKKALKPASLNVEELQEEMPVELLLSLVDDMMSSADTQGIKWLKKDCICKDKPRAKVEMNLVQKVYNEQVSDATSVHSLSIAHKCDCAAEKKKVEASGAGGKIKDDDGYS